MQGKKTELYSYNEKSLHKDIKGCLQWQKQKGRWQRFKSDSVGVPFHTHVTAYSSAYLSSYPFNGDESKLDKQALNL